MRARVVALLAAGAFAAGAFAACAHTPDLPLRADPSPPPGSTTEVLAASDGTQLLVRRWAPTGDARGVLLIVHGLKDYSARYASLASRVAAQGYDVYALDLRGHGRSAGPRVAPHAWTDYVDDVDRLLHTIEAREPGKPVFVFGHSMGGAIATRAAEIHTPKVAGLILSGPALAIDAAPLLIAATRLTAFLMPRFAALKLDDDAFSSDPANAAAVARDPWISDGGAPASTAAGLVEGMHAIWRDLGALTMPILAMHGSADRLTAPSGSRTLIEYAPAHDKTLRIYDGYFHDLLHEPGGRGQHVEDDLVGWLTAHGGGGEAVATPPVYAGHLAGDPRGWTQALAAAGGASVDSDGNFHGAGRVALDLARPAPIGWHGALVAQWLDGRWAVALRPVGLAVRISNVLQLGVSGGGALISGTTLAWAAGAWLEEPLGSAMHFGMFADYTYRDTSELAVGATFRFGGDRRYWPRARAGLGPAITIGEDSTTHAAWFVLAGLQLYGAD